MAALVLAACTSPTFDPPTTSSLPVESSFFDGETETLEVDGVSLVVAVADSGNERSQGLMGVEDLGELDGMLFVFENPRKLNFTMRDTLIPLDLWFIDDEGIIGETLEMEPCLSSPCAHYRSEAKYGWALETPLGRFDFEVGDRVSNGYFP